jgi:hypothetical protein
MPRIVILFWLENSSIRRPIVHPRAATLPPAAFCRHSTHVCCSDAPLPLPPLPWKPHNPSLAISHGDFKFKILTVSNLGRRGSNGIGYGVAWSTYDRALVSWLTVGRCRIEEIGPPLMTAHVSFSLGFFDVVYVLSNCNKARDFYWENTHMML